MALTLLLYHSVDESGSFLSVSPDAFRRQMRALRRSGRRVLSVAEAARAARAGDPLRDAACVTFDDAYLSVAETAWPILKDEGLTATIYCVSGRMGGSADWLRRDFPAVFAEPPDDEAALREVDAVLTIGAIRDRALAADPAEALRRASALPIMGWDAIRALMAEGADTGGHTLTHPRLSHLDPGAVAREVADDREALAEALGTRPMTFAYPFGDLSDAAVTAVRDAGYAAAVTSAPGGVLVPDRDPYRWARIGIWPDVRPWKMRLYLSRLYPLLRAA